MVLEVITLQESKRKVSKFGCHPEFAWGRANRIHLYLEDIDGGLESIYQLEGW